MRSFAARVEKSAQLTSGEHCAASEEALAEIGRAVGQQVRIRRSDEEFALFTVRRPTHDSDPGLVFVSESGLQRLGANQTIDASVRNEAVDPAYANKSDDEVRNAGELVERFIDGADELIVIASHGGAIEAGTDAQAELVARELRACAWSCKGWKPGGGAFARWHIASTDIHEASFPKLGALEQRRFRHAVAFHGWNRREIVVGGAAPPTLKRLVVMAVKDAVRNSTMEVRVARPDEHYGGDDPQNLVNRLTRSGSAGVQLEQSLEARENHGQAIAEAVALVYRELVDFAATSTP